MTTMSNHRVEPSSGIEYAMSMPFFASRALAAAWTTSPLKPITAQTLPLARSLMYLEAWKYCTYGRIFSNSRSACL